MPGPRLLSPARAASARGQQPLPALTRLAEGKEEKKKEEEREKEKKNRNKKNLKKKEILLLCLKVLCNWDNLGIFSNN